MNMHAMVVGGGLDFHPWRHNSSNVGGVTEGQVRHNSSSVNGALTVSQCSYFV